MFLRDIEKALKLKEVLNLWEKLPKEYYEFLPLFNRAAVNQLPPHYSGVNHKIEFLFKMKPPFCSLYVMSRNKLEVMNKELKDLLIKDFIRAFKSLITAPVLFIKKPEGGLRFYMDY